MLEKFVVIQYKQYIIILVIKHKGGRKVEEQKIGEEQTVIGNISNAEIGGAGQANLPQEVSIWSKIKSFLLQDVNRDVVITMTPKQEKVLREVHDFWFQKVNFGKVKDFLFQEITLGKKNK